jgi:hypothetical protein
MAGGQLEWVSSYWSGVNEMHVKSLYARAVLQINKANLLPVAMINDKPTSCWQRRPENQTFPA